MIFFLLPVLLLAAGPVWAQPSADEKLWHKAVADSDAKRYSQAIQEFTAIIDSEKKAGIQQAAPLEERAWAYRRLSEWQKALADYDVALTLEPKDANLWADRGMTRKAAGDFDGMLSDWDTAARLDPTLKGYDENAHSTWLYNKALLIFWGLALLLVAIGMVPLARNIVRISRAGG